MRVLLGLTAFMVVCSSAALVSAAGASSEDRPPGPGAVAAMAGLAGSTVKPASAVPGIVVKVGPPGDIDRLAAHYQLRVVRPILASRGIFLLGFSGSAPPKAKRVKAAANEIAKEPGVVYAEVDAFDEIPSDTSFHAWVEGTWVDVGNDERSWLGQSGLAYLDLEGVHRIAAGRGVRVALLDTGIDPNQPFLAGHLGPGGYDYVDDDSVPTDERAGIDNNHDGRSDEAFGHGTHTAGLVALVAPEATLIPYRVLDSDGEGDLYRVAEAIDDAVRDGVDVINMSFGTDGKLASRVIQDALKNALKQNVIVVAAAGNSGSKSAFSPASEKDVLGVAATETSNDALVSFSNYGKEAFVAAPGVDVVSTVPGSGFGRWSGTSMATAIVSGEAAVIRSHNPKLKRQAVKDTIGRSASKLSGPNKTEHGLIDILEALTRH
jgi:subtilisin family serine protease